MDSVINLCRVARKISTNNYVVVYCRRQSTFVAPSRPSLKVTDKSAANVEGREDPKLFSQEYIPPQVQPEWHANKLKYKLERMDCLRRRNVIDIPEFYPGSIIAVTTADAYAPGKTHRFVGRCLYKDGFGLGCKFLLRNVIDEEGVEVMYQLFSPIIQKYEVLRLEKWLDTDLRYLRDADPAVCTINPNMAAEAPPPPNQPLPVFKGKVNMKDKVLWGWKYHKHWPPPKNAYLAEHFIEEQLIVHKKHHEEYSHLKYDICRHYDFINLKKDIMKEMKDNKARIKIADK